MRICLLHCFRLLEICGYAYFTAFIHLRYAYMLICLHHCFRCTCIMPCMLIGARSLHSDTSIRLTPAHAELWFGFTAKCRVRHAIQGCWTSQGRYESLGRLDT